MKLKDYCATRNETEVWDEYVDVYPPIYAYGDMTYADNGDERYLSLLEKWLFNLEVITANDVTCTVDVFHAIQANWREIVGMMKDIKGYEHFLFSYGDDIIEDDDAIADITCDVFVTLSQGYESMAKDFCVFLGLEQNDEK